MNLDQALQGFRKVVERVTGDYTVLNNAGFWRRTMKPRDEATSWPSSKEAVIVVDGEVEIIRQSGLSIKYKAGEIAYLAKDRHYKIVAGEAGATIEYKYF